MRLFKKMMAYTAAAVMIVGMFSGCGSANNGNESTAANEGADAAGKTYTLGISAYPAFYTWYICEKENLFEKNGVNVELKYFPVYSDCVQAFSSGQLDMAAIAMPDTIAPHINNIPFKVVMVNENSNGADGLVANSDIKTIADLKGKSVATEYGTIEHFFLLNALESAGLSESDINFVNLSISDSAPAYLSGSVEAACLWEPSLSQAQEKENSNVLITSEDTLGLIPDVVVARDDMIQNNNEDLKAVLNSYFDAMEFYVANEDQAIKDMAEGAEISQEEMKVSMSGSKLFSLQQAIDSMDSTVQDYSSLSYTTAKIADFLKSVNMIDSVPEDTTKMLDSSVLKEILGERGDVAAPDTKK